MKSIKLFILLIFLFGIFFCEGIDKKGLSVVKTIDKKGGVLEIENLKVIVPPDAVKEETEFKAVIAEEVPEGNIGYAFKLYPEGVNFKRPIKLVFSIAKEKFDNNLAVATVIDGEWKALDNSKADEVKKEVWGEVYHFSIFGVIVLCIPQNEICADHKDNDCDGEVDEDCAKLLDVLFVIDDSPSMCQEQENLAKGFHIFTDILKKYDARIAVTTTNVCPPEKNGVRGKFVYQPTNTFPPACYVTEVLDCLGDKQCNDTFGDQTWQCKHPPAKDIFSCDKIEDNKNNKLIVINSYCTYRCNKENVAECPYLFGYPDECKKICEQSTNCYKSCSELFSEEAQKCSNVCDEDHSCVETCIDFFGEKQTCAKVCSSQSCLSECEGNFIQKSQNFGESFPCYAICKAKKEYSCKDQCILNFGEPRYRCIWPGGSEINSGCLLPPPTKFCPFKGPKILDNDVVNIYYELYKKGEWKGDPKWQILGEKELKEKIFEYLFLCMATVGVEQPVCGSQEQPLLAALMALDPLGENSSQSKNFLRKDAYLLIIFVGDEDDCSTAYKIMAQDYSKCPCLKTTEEGGPLYPVSYFVNKFKTLKKDPSMVMIAAITGDAIIGSSTSPGNDIEKIRERFFECKCDENKPIYSQGTYICSSKQGKADYGKRFFELAKEFGENGIIANICEPIEKGIKKIAYTVSSLMQ